MNLRKRALEEAVLRASRMYPVLLLTGPRASGKTTLLKKLAGENRAYVSLEDPGARMEARQDPGLFLQRYRPPVIIDEAQHAPELLSHIKLYTDSIGRKGDFWLISSRNLIKDPEYGSLISRRTCHLRLLPFSFAEIQRLSFKPFLPEETALQHRAEQGPPREVGELYDSIVKGGFPALYREGGPDRKAFYQDYVSRFLQEESSGGEIRDDLRFFRFLTAAAAATGKPAVYDELARQSDISPPTAKKWMALLERCQWVALVPAYEHRALKRAVKTPVMYFLDTGLCAHLLRWENGETLERGAMSGAFWRTYVFSEIYKSYCNEGIEPDFRCYRDKDKKEIDLLIRYEEILFPVYFRKTTVLSAEKTDAGRILAPSGERVGPRTVLYLGRKMENPEPSLWGVPVGLV